jgi:hypothetical protein
MHEIHQQPNGSAIAGVEALARAYRDLFQTSGEAPRLAYFDDELILSLKVGLGELAKRSILRKKNSDSVLEGRSFDRRTRPWA